MNYGDSGVYLSLYLIDIENDRLSLSSFIYLFTHKNRKVKKVQNLKEQEE